MGFFPSCHHTNDMSHSMMTLNEFKLLSFNIIISQPDFVGFVGVGSALQEEDRHFSVTINGRPI